MSDSEIVFTQDQIHLKKSLREYYDNKQLCILGRKRSTAIYYVYITINKEEREESFVEEQQFVKFYDIQYKQPQQSQIIALAFALNKYHIQVKYCSKCGQKLTYMNQTHIYLECKQCHREQYPTVSPAVIIMITCKNKVLLCHRRDNIYTHVSGFIDLAESAEDAAIREMNEEIGLQIKDIIYIKQMSLTQFWPSRFPSLMLAYECEVQDEFQIRPSREITDAKWIGKEEFLKAAERSDRNEQEEWIVPKKVAVARVMLDQWFEQK